MEKLKLNKLDGMQAKILEKPIISSKKVYVIKDADKMTKEAGNCLLKTLEEPPSFVTIVLIASNESALLNTIRSRCMKVLFRKIEPETLTSFLQKKLGIQKVTKERLKAFDGSIEKALKIEEKQEVYDEIQKIFSQVEAYTLLEVMPHLESLYKNKEIIYDLLEYINIILLEQAKTKPQYITYIETIEEVKKNLKLNSNYDMSIDKMLFRIWEESV
jgi:DNA polymerase-3 subunit delta'